MNTNLRTTLHRLYSQLKLHETAVLIILLICLSIGSAGLLIDVQNRFSTTVPADGGTYREGIVGFARYANPVLAATDADRDITELVYAGLMKKASDGSLSTELATDYTISDDQTTFTFQLDPSAEFHDGHPVRAEDVVYTIRTIKDPQISSPKRARWQGVTVSAVNDTTVRFETEDNFPGLLMNATVEILPKHLWQQESPQSFPFADLNTNPVGAGPYRVVGVTRNADGLPTEYELTRFDNYSNRRPYIEDVQLRFFTDSQKRRQAYKNGDIDGLSGIDPAYANRLKQDGVPVSTHQYNRVFSVFFNGNNEEALVDTGVRQALAAAVPKDKIVNNALAGYATAIDSPLPPALSEPFALATSSSETPDALLTAAGWELNESDQRTQDDQQLQITLSTVSVPSLEKTANLIAESWRDLGVAVDIETLPTDDITRNVIRPRNYEALLFGQSVESLRDLHSYWHSSRREDPGLNFAQYTNNQADQDLANVRTATSTNKIQQSAEDFLTHIRQDQPAAFVFSPSFIYVLPPELGNVTLPPITESSDRFTNISNWHADTKKLWNVFLDN